MFDRKLWNVKLSQLDQTEAFRAKACVYLMLVLSLLYLVVLPIRYMIFPFGPIQSIVITISVILNLVSGVVIFLKPEKVIGRVLFLVGLFILLAGAAYVNGGLAAPIVTLSMLYPIAASFLIGRNGAVLFTLLSLVLIVGSYLTKITGILPTAHLSDPVQLDQARVLIFSAVTIFSFTIGLFYENFRRKLQSMERRIAELDTVQAMIVTYNHEINNPLMIALTGLQMMRDGKDFRPEQFEKIERNLNRIANVVRKIRDIPQQGDLETGEYVGSTKYVKVS